MFSYIHFVKHTICSQSLNPVKNDILIDLFKTIARVQNIIFCFLTYRILEFLFTQLLKIFLEKV